MGFDPNRKADIFKTVEAPTDRNLGTAKELPITKQTSAPRRANGQTDANRISSARERATAYCKIINAPGAQYGFQYHESYYRDFAGPETSLWDAEHWVFVAEVLETPILKNIKHKMGNRYDARLGKFVSKADTDVVFLSLQELKDAVDARIAELGLSKVLIWEWLAGPGGPIGGEWWRKNLSERIQRFRSAAQSDTASTLEIQA
jgi:hypothetical protein